MLRLGLRVSVLWSVLMTRSVYFITASAIRLSSNLFSVQCRNLGWRNVDGTSFRAPCPIEGDEGIRYRQAPSKLKLQESVQRLAEGSGSPSVGKKATSRLERSLGGAKAVSDAL